jgi:dCMP deaminase
MSMPNVNLVAGRPTWDETWVNVARVIAKRGRCAFASVGAVIVTKDNRIDSASYNGPPAGLYTPGTCESWCPRFRGIEAGTISRGGNYSECVALHAEANAVARSNWSEIQLGTIYTSAAMCMGCAQLVCNTGIKRVVHVVEGPDDLRRDPDRVETFIKSAGLEVRRWTGN